MRLVYVSLLALALAVAACSSQQPSPTGNRGVQQSASPVPRVCLPFTSGAPVALKESKEYQEAALTVFNSDGPVTSLSKDDFTVEADGTNAQVQYLEYVRNAPASVVIVVDTSGSTRNVIPQERVLIGSLADALDSRDELALIAFNRRPFLLQSFTTDHELVRRRLTLLHAFGQSAIYDSLTSAVKTAARGCYTQAAVVLITDTIDNFSKQRADDVSHIARESNVRVYVITLGGKVAASTFIGRLLNGPGGAYDPKQAKTIAEQLVLPTRGEAVVLPPRLDDNAMASAAKSLARDIGAVYVIGFAGIPTNLKVQVKNHPDYVVEVISGGGGE